MRCLFATLSMIMIACSPAASSEPTKPASRDNVLLLVRPADNPASQAIVDLRQRLQLKPDDQVTAAALARLYIAEARTTSEPRYWGYAEAALKPWSGTGDLHPDLLLMRAMIRQYAHDFQAALVDLDAVLKAQPENGQARLTRAFIYQAQGEPSSAIEDCMALRRARPALVFTTCRARILSLTGGAGTALTMMENAFAATSSDTDAGLLGWAHKVQADTARRIGRLDLAQSHLRLALEASPNDAKTAAALADLLLLQHAPDEVLNIDIGSFDAGFELRRLLARRSLGDDIVRERARLAERFETAPLQDGPRELRNETLFALEFGNDPQTSLKLATTNWATHKEPDDARLLVRAALAAGDRERAAEVMAWARRQALEDVELQALLGSQS